MSIYSIGTIVQNTKTHEHGRVVRIVPLKEILPKVEPDRILEAAYIVSLVPGPSAFVREALWFQSEVGVAGTPNAFEPAQDAAAPSAD